MKKTALFLAAWLVISGCSLYGQSSLYKPNPLDRAIERATIQAQKDGSGIVTSVELSDFDIVTFTNDILSAYRKRGLVARSFEYGTAGAEAGLGVIGAFVSVLGWLPPVGTIISIAVTLVGKVTDILKPEERISAYADGASLLESALARYFREQKGQVLATGSTPAGLDLLRETNCSISKVEKAVSGRIIAGEGLC